jgi:hypothetical protein
MIAIYVKKKGWVKITVKEKKIVLYIASLFSQKTLSSFGKAVIERKASSSVRARHRTYGPIRHQPMKSLQIS